ncbi:glycosyltransferase [Candidatus Nomurabacteria bacterium]|nr:MAG: glycosyltransferase [Candidatus Nomurabacteria bacterium]
MKKNRLLILTQTVDRNDPILGFFHSWIIEFSKKYEFVTVICLKKGEFDFPLNVKVLTLGKESGVSKIKYIFNFFKYIIAERKNYEKVFVHMNEEYVLLGGVIWRFLCKEVFLWRNHKLGSWKTQVAGFMAQKVFYTSSGSYTSKFKNSIKMPVGIDENLFRPVGNIERKQHSFLYVGRISEIKNVDIIINAFTKLFSKNSTLDFTLNLVGPIDGDIDKKYTDALIETINKNNLTSKITFLDSVDHTKLPQIYSAHRFCINLTSSGSFDKTIWESAYCGCVPLVYNTSFLDELPEGIRKEIGIQSLEIEDVARMFEKCIVSCDVEQDTLVEIGKKHSLKLLMDNFSMYI